MSFKNFSHLNEFIATTAEVADKLNSIISACQQGITQLSSVKQISDAYARQYSLVQQIQYDADGNIQDVTSAERLSVPNTVIDNARDMINKCSLAIQRIKPVDLGSAAIDINITPTARLYHYDNVHTDQTVQPSNVVTIPNYYNVSGGSLYLSNELIDAISGIQRPPGLTHINPSNGGHFAVTLVAKLPYSVRGIPGEHQLSIIAVNTARNYYVRHTGSFTKFSTLADIRGKDLFSPDSYNLDYANVANTFKWFNESNYQGGQFKLHNAIYAAPGDILSLYYSPSDGICTLDSIDCFYDITAGTTDDIWAVLTGLADNGRQILNILNTL